MKSKLTNEMREALRNTAGAPLTVEDDLTRQEYVLIPIALYRRLAASFADERFDVADAYAAQSAAAGATGWDDPAMNVYDHYDEMLRVDRCLKASLGI